MNKVKSENAAVYQLIELCKKDNILLWLEDDKLKYRAPKEKIDLTLLKKLKEEKEAIIKYLEQEESLSKSGGFNLTPIQYAYLIGRSSDYELGNINAHYYTEYSCNDIDADRLQKVINQVIKKHDALRTKIYATGYQEVMDSVPELIIPVSNIDQESDLEEIRREWSHHMYSLGSWPMFHFQISKCKNGMDILHFSFDCIILDAWSAQFMLLEVFDLYQGKVRAPLSFTFEEYVKRSEDYLSKDSNCIAAEEYWADKLQNMPQSPQLPFKKRFSLIQKPYFSRIYYKFKLNETKLLYDKAKRYRVTPSAIICTVYMKVLSHFSSQKDLTLNLTLFNRLPINKEVPKVLGDFTNIGLASYFYDESLNFIDEVRDIQQQFFKLIEYRSYDGTKLLKQLSTNNLGKAIMPVVYTSMLQGQLECKQSSDFRERYAISQTPQVVLDHQVRDDNGGLLLAWDYVLEAFDSEMIQDIFATYIKTIKKLILEERWEQPIIIEK